MPKGSDLLVAALENEGVDRIFGVPGEENLDVVESLRNSSIKLILTRHEQGAAFMAATYGRLTGKPGVCITTLGPGALNLTTGAAYALLGAMPMIMLTGQKGIMSSRQAKFQIVDVVSAFKPLTKLSCRSSAQAAFRPSFATPFESPWRSDRVRFCWSCQRTSLAKRLKMSRWWRNIRSKFLSLTGPRSTVPPR